MKGPVPVPLDRATAVLLADGIAAIGIGALPWNSEQRSLRARVSYLRSVLGGAWPELSDAALGRDMAWLVPMLLGKSSLAEIGANDLAGALDALVSWTQRGEIDRLLPSHFEAPSGSRVPIDYAGENGPALSIRVQELFGLTTHPTIGPNHTPLRITLLSPARAPLQTTRDLPRFWTTSYADVRRDMRGAYPRHPWPEDPTQAAPTLRAKPRGT